MPRASVTQAMVFAVNIPEHEPGPGQARSSRQRSSASSISPAVRRPTASNVSCTRSRRVVPRTPASIGPAVTTMAGMSSRAAAINMPGVILSQSVRSTSASSPWPSATPSTPSATLSRLGSEKLMPRWPIAIPSQMPGTPNTNGTPPPAQTPCSMARSSSLIPQWPGMRSLKLLAMPTKGFSSRADPSPVAIRSERRGAASTPRLTISLRTISTSSFTSVTPRRAWPVRGVGTRFECSPSRR